jgi:hypothetical protein
LRSRHAPKGLARGRPGAEGVSQIAGHLNAQNGAGIAPKGRKQGCNLIVTQTRCVQTHHHGFEDKTATAWRLLNHTSDRSSGRPEICSGFSC